MLLLWSFLGRGAVPSVDIVLASARWPQRPTGAVWDIEVVGDRLFVACDDGLQILDFKNPSAPLVGRTAPGAQALAIADDYVYLASGGELRVIDVRDLSRPV